MQFLLKIRSLMRSNLPVLGIVVLLFSSLVAADKNSKPNTDAEKRFRRLKPADCGVGRKVSDVQFRDIDGALHRLSDYKACSAIVVAVTSTTCPLTKRYLPTLARLEQTYAKDVVFIFVNSSRTDTDESIRTSMKTHRLNGPYTLDSEMNLLSGFGARSTTDCFVVDAALTLRYRGAVDDQYGIGYALAQPKQNFVADALDAILAGRTPQIEATEAPGCLLNLRKPANVSTQRTKSTEIANDIGNTYHNRISRIVQSNCIACHRADGAAPFSLTRPTDLTSRTEMIEKVVREGTMPPWFAAPAGKGTATRWTNDRSLADVDKSDLISWLNDDQLLGDPADAPISPVYSTDWQIGKPDAIVQLPIPVLIPDEGIMPYQVISVATDFDEEKWISGYEIRPTARDVVHHVAIFVESGPEPDKKGDMAEENGAHLALYVPGNGHNTFPERCAKRLPKGARLRFQIHYTPNGTSTQDQMELGLVFSKQPPAYELHVTGIVNRKIKIPPEASHHKESGWIRLNSDVKILSFVPHMHVRGKAFRFQAVSDRGESTTLLDVPRYDFNWQLAYHSAAPITLVKGTKLIATGWYDNSAGNPANPDSKQSVTWGSQSSDEMLVGYIEYIIPGERLNRASH